MSIWYQDARSQNQTAPGRAHSACTTATSQPRIHLSITETRARTWTYGSEVPPALKMLESAMGSSAPASEREGRHQCRGSDGKRAAGGSRASDLEGQRSGARAAAACCSPATRCHRTLSTRLGTSCWLTDRDPARGVGGECQLSVERHGSWRPVAARPFEGKRHEA
eukprot:710154-Rhodomonas_salina.2